MIKQKSLIANNLKKEKKPNSESGGDYWITSLSAISNVFKTENVELLNEKISSLIESTIIELKSI